MNGPGPEPTLLLLGPPEVEAGSARFPLPAEAPLWLLTLLGCHEEPVTRPELLELLYAQVDEPAARNRLRNLLHRLRQQPWSGGLQASGPGLYWTAPVDVRTFRQACRDGRWAEALALYRGPLLDGCRPADLPEFEAWLDAERDELQASWLDAALQHAAELERAGQARLALPWLDRLLGVSPYSEEAVQAALRCAAQLGDPAEAERVYSRFQLQLQRDLGVYPSAATTRLYEGVQQAAAPAAPLPTFRHSGPPLFGRHHELAWIQERLDQPDGRLLTLLGPGGAGKTRLSQEVLAGQDAGVRVAFVPLEAATAAEGMVTALAAALGLPPGPAETLAAQLPPVLQTGPHLLVLDNLEHLLAAPSRAEVLTLIQTLLEAVPTLRLIVTSRVRLGLQAEWVISLGGLDYPQIARLDLAAQSSAVRLFVERAGRVRGGFGLTPQNVDDLIRVCQLTEGLPLALELTAAWMGTFDVADVVAELSASLDLLDSDAPDRPERHRSLRAAFGHSWRLLGPDEQRALARLSVFRGGFERAAALAVTGGRLRPLLTLADHSLLRRDRAGRYTLHEVVRQYAAEQLQRQPAEQVQARQAHADWYAALAQEAAPHLHGPEQTDWLARLQTEHDNLEAALEWTFAQAGVQQALELTVALHWFWYVRGHHRSGYGWLRMALERPGEVPAPLRAAALSRLGGLARDLGEYPQAQAWLEQALTLVQDRDARLEAEVRHGLGLSRRERGELEAAGLQLQRAEQLQRTLELPWALASTLNDLGIVWALQDDLDRARPLFQESLTLKERIGDRQGVAYALANLANVTDDLGEYQRLTEQSLAIKRELGDRQGMANSLFNLADMHLNRGELAMARHLLQEALELYWQLGRQRGVAAALTEAAKLAASSSLPLLCLQLAGAADALLEAVGVPAQGFAVGGLLEQARTLAGDGWADHYRRGAALPLEAAVRLALEVTSEQAAPDPSPS
ncbi:ATP-binding protein [Deinococcus sonorensis]|uniref:ATP-binding protein n=2 Tax=Deinococcus sonorensis TaxID=309891 RepID=A0ABV8Y079_9DEIO